MALSETLIKEAMHLKAYEKIMFIEALIKNLNKVNPDIESTWIEESFKRLEDYKNGKAKTFSYKEIFDEN